MAYYLVDDIAELRERIGLDEFDGANELGASKSEAIDEFASYVACYDLSNPQIAHKYSHTLRVTLNASEIATMTTSGMPLYGADKEQNATLASDWVPDEGACFLMGLLHDLGRFPQYAMYRTYSDMASFPHAEMSYEMLTKFGMIRSFTNYRDGDLNARHLADQVLQSIRSHSLLRVDVAMGTGHAYCDILRDADKIDILEAYCHAISSPDFKGMVTVTKEAMDSGRTLPPVAPADAPFVNEMARMGSLGFGVSDAVVADVMSGGLVDRRNIRTAGDAILSCVAMYSGIATTVARTMLSERQTMSVIGDSVIGAYGREDPSGMLEQMVHAIVLQSF